MSIQTDQTEGSDDETSTLDSGFDNENVLVETLQSRLYESLKVFLSRLFYTFLGNLRFFVKNLEMVQSKLCMYVLTYRIFVFIRGFYSFKRVSLNTI